MSTITDELETPPGAIRLWEFFSNIFSVIAICAALMIGWVAVMAATMVIFEPTDSALVIVRDHSILERLPADVYFTNAGKGTLTVRSDKPGFVRELYASGAVLVFPALNNGCVALRPE